MAITRAEVEKIIVDRCGPWMKKGMMSTVTDGTNPDLNDPIREALMQMGFTLADPLVVTDADIAQVDTDTQLLELLDRIELRTFKTIERRFASPNIRIDVIEIWNRELHQQLDKIIQDLEEWVEEHWGPGETPANGAGTGTRGTGSIYVPTQETMPYPLE